MMELINKKLVLKIINDMTVDEGDYKRCTNLIEQLNVIESRPKGKWIDGGRYSNHICSICREEAECLQAGGGVEFLSDFCPYCGADMRGEE